MRPRALENLIKKEKIEKLTKNHSDRLDSTSQNHPSKHSTQFLLFVVGLKFKNTNKIKQTQPQNHDPNNDSPSNSSVTTCHVIKSKQMVKSIGPNRWKITCVLVWCPHQESHHRSCFLSAAGSIPAPLVSLTLTSTSFHGKRGGEKEKP